MSEIIQVGKEYRSRYKVEKQIGKGGTSFVYKLYDQKLGRDVCLKKGVAQGSYTKQHIKSLFSKEANILQLLQGQDCPQFFEFSETDMELYMEYCEGRSLEEFYEHWEKSNQFPDQAGVLKVFLPLVRAVKHCHSKQVIVLDIKPKNIIVGRRKESQEIGISLLDFGSAYLSTKKIEETAPTYSYGYAAPEIIDGKIPTYASDIYSLGAILYLLLSHQNPTQYQIGNWGENTTLIDPSLRDLVSSMIDLNSIVRPSLENVVLRCKELEKFLAPPPQKQIQCSHCLKMTNLGSFCSICGHKIIRGGTVKIDTFHDKDPAIAKMKASFSKQIWLDVLSYAHQANEEGHLDEEGLAMAIIALAQLPNKSIFQSDMELWLRCSSRIDPQLLPDSLCKAFLKAWGVILEIKQVPFAHYRNWFQKGIEKWHNDDVLWNWLALSSSLSEQPKILEQGLACNPESGRIRRLLGELLGRNRQFTEALKLWSEAIDRGERDFNFLVKVYKLATHLQDNPRREALQRQILATTCNTADESLEIAKFARNEGEIIEALAIIEQGLLKDPLHILLRKCKAQVLFDQHKYELVLEYTQEMNRDQDILLLRGVSQYELRQYEEASKELIQAIKANHGLEVAWEYLVRSYLHLHQLENARQTCNNALQIFPNNQNLRQLHDKL